MHNEHIKLADLGFAKDLDDSLVKTYVGTPIYMSPEMIELFWIKFEIPTVKTDIW